jgi:hypothetical protein
LGFEQVQQLFQLARQTGMLGQQSVDAAGVATGVQGFIDADPIRAVALAGCIPLGVMPRRQADDFLRPWRAGLGEAVVLLITSLDKGSKVAVVVAVASHRVFKKHTRLLVALAAQGDSGRT